MANPLLDALGDFAGYVSDALDKPGRAVRGGLAGRADELAAFIPFSDTMGLTDPSRAVSGRDLLEQSGFATGNSTLDDVLGFGVETALDPTTLIGAGIGNRLGRAGGRALEKAAMARGPGFATTAEDLAGMVGRASIADPAEREIAETMVRSLGNVSGAAAEVPPGSSYLKAGREAASFRTPAGDVVRLGFVPENAAGRPVAGSVLQAKRGADYGLSAPVPAGVTIVDNPAAVRAERVPFVERAGDRDFWLKGSGQPGLTRLGAMKKQAAGEGLRFHDAHAGNVGMLGDRPVILDPGAVESEAAIAARTSSPQSSPLAALGLSPTGSRRTAVAPPSIAYQDVTRAGAPSALTRALLDLLGGRPAMRRALDAGLASPDYATSLGRAGAVAGGSLGAF